MKERMKLFPLGSFACIVNSSMQPFKARTMYGNERNNFDTEELRKPLGIDFDIMFPDIVHEVHQYDDFFSHINNLLRKKKVPFKVRRIDDIQYDIGFKNDITGNTLFVVKR